MSRVRSAQHRSASPAKPVTKEILVDDFGPESEWSNYTYTYISTSTEWPGNEPPKNAPKPTIEVPQMRHGPSTVVKEWSAVAENASSPPAAKASAVVEDWSGAASSPKAKSGSPSVASPVSEGALFKSSSGMSGEEVELCDASVEVTLEFDSAELEVRSVAAEPKKEAKRVKVRKEKQRVRVKRKKEKHPKDEFDLGRLSPIRGKELDLGNVTPKQVPRDQEFDLGKLSPREGQRVLDGEVERREPDRASEKKQRHEVDIEELKHEVEIVDFIPGKKDDSDSRKFVGNFTREVITNAHDEVGTDSKLSDSMIECFRVKLKLQRVRNLPAKVPASAVVYCSVKLSDDSKEQRTKPRQAVDLRWHEAFEVTCSSLGSAMFVQVKSEEPVDGDCLLAFVSLDAKELPRGQKISKWFKCQDNQGEPCDCEIYMEIDCRLASEKSPAKQLPPRVNISVSILEARALPLDSYTAIARIRGSNEIVRTQPVRSSNPQWNETFRLVSATPSNDYFVTILRRVDADTGDDDIAAMVLRVADIPIGVRTEKWYSMKATKGHSLDGLKIRLVLVAEPSHEAPRSEIVDSSLSDRSGKDLLTVKVIEGKHIAPDQVYCLVKLNKKQGVLRTRVIADTRKPQWRENFTIPVEDRTKDSLCVILRNAEKQLGYFDVPLSELVPGQTHDEWYSLIPWNQGKIHLELRLDSAASTSSPRSVSHLTATTGSPRSVSNITHAAASPRSVSTITAPSANHGDSESYVVGRLSYPDTSDSESSSDTVPQFSSVTESDISLQTVPVFRDE